MEAGHFVPPVPVPGPLFFLKIQKITKAYGSYGLFVVTALFSRNLAFPQRASFMMYVNMLMKLTSIQTQLSPAVIEIDFGLSSSVVTEHQTKLAVSRSSGLVVLVGKYVD